MKRLVVDARMVQSSGIGRYLRQILEGLRHDSRFETTLLGDPPQLEPFVNSTARIVAHRAPIYSIREQLGTPLKIPACDLFFTPHYVVPVLYRGPMAVTIHDVIHLEDPAFVPNRAARFYARIMVRAATRRARRILTDSAYTARRLVELVRAPRERIRVVPLGIDQRFFETIPVEHAARVRTTHHLPGPYVLFVGNAKRHKNLRTLIGAFARLRRGALPHDLVIAGATSGMRTDLPALEAAIHEHGLDGHVRFLGHVPDGDLPALYHEASLLVLPSLVEGFGLPPLEAMACGTPVVVSDRASLPEVCGDAAEYYAPVEDHGALAEAMERVLVDNGRRTHLTAAGRRHAEYFTAGACAAATLDALYAI